MKMERDVSIHILDTEKEKIINFLKAQNNPNIIILLEQDGIVKYELYIEKDRFYAHNLLTTFAIFRAMDEINDDLKNKYEWYTKSYLVQELLNNEK